MDAVDVAGAGALDCLAATFWWRRGADCLDATECTDFPPLSVLSCDDDAVFDGGATYEPGAWVHELIEAS